MAHTVGELWLAALRRQFSITKAIRMYKHHGMLNTHQSSKHNFYANPLAVSIEGVGFGAK
jgi:hypothetical protein